jgi:hypothetical protein
MEMSLSSFNKDLLTGDPWLSDYTLHDDDSLCNPLQQSPPTEVKQTSSDLISFTHDLHSSDQSPGHNEKNRDSSNSVSVSVPHDGMAGMPKEPVSLTHDRMAGMPEESLRSIVSTPETLFAGTSGTSALTKDYATETKDYATKTMSFESRTVSHENRGHYLPCNSSGNQPERTLRRSARTKTLTEKGYNYQLETSLKVFQSALANHKRHVTICKKILNEGSFDVKVLTDSRNRLEKCIVSIADAFHRVVEIDPQQYVQFIDVVNEREAVNLQTLHEIVWIY